ncbi:DUF1934 domain-containing protein [Paenibacillus sp. HB172176]|uniref:DUF1934 domain-containing protein n=1 Tax=Paenibacillus sp. HB172176 TaxID=2493690 RepID=UPI00143ADBE8|nr:DUF1934 domain-containing protein [Paenibacillus sp. HB172176]
MTVGRNVCMTLESRQDGEIQSFQYKGEWFRKEHALYLRYREGTGEGERNEVRTLLRYSPGELSIARSGAVDSRQWFVPGQRRRGSYRSAATAFELDTLTTALAAYALDKDRLPETEEPERETSLPSKLPFIIEWQYELYVEEQLSGNFHIRLWIQEERKA